MEAIKLTMKLSVSVDLKQVNLNLIFFEVLFNFS